MIVALRNENDELLAKIQIDADFKRKIGALE